MTYYKEVQTGDYLLELFEDSKGKINIQMTAPPPEIGGRVEVRIIERGRRGDKKNEIVGLIELTKKENLRAIGCTNKFNKADGTPLPLLSTTNFFKLFAQEPEIIWRFKG